MMQTSGEVEIIKPPHAILSKISSGGANAITKDQLEQIDRDIIVRLGHQYLDWVQNDVDEMEASLAEVKPGDDIESEQVKRLRAVLHEIRGMGGTFDYDLVTAFSDQMYRLVHAEKVISAERIAALKVHLDSVKIVIAEQLKNDGGARGAELTQGLRMVFDKFSVQPS